jgi:hypothetical protein
MYQVKASPLGEVTIHTQKRWSRHGKLQVRNGREMHSGVFEQDVDVFQVRCSSVEIAIPQKVLAGSDGMLLALPYPRSGLNNENQPSLRDRNLWPLDRVH